MFGKGTYSCQFDSQYGKKWRDKGHARKFEAVAQAGTTASQHLSWQHG